VKTRIMSH